MSPVHLRRTGAAAGLAYVVLVLVGNSIATSGSTVEASSSGAEILADLKAHTGGAWLAGTILEVLAFVALIVSIAYIAGIMRRAEGDQGWLWLVALGGGLLTCAVKLGSAAPALAAVWRIDELDPLTARTLVDLNGMAFMVSMLTFAVFVAPVAIVALRHGLLPRGLALAGVTLPVLQLALLPLGPEGPAFAPFLLSLLWLAASSVVLLRRGGEPRTLPVAPRATA